MNMRLYEIKLSLTIYDFNEYFLSNQRVEKRHNPNSPIRGRKHQRDPLKFSYKKLDKLVL